MFKRKTYGKYDVICFYICSKVSSDASWLKHSFSSLLSQICMVWRECNIISSLLWFSSCGALSVKLICTRVTQNLYLFVIWIVTFANKKSVSIIPFKILYLEIGRSVVAELLIWTLPVLCYARPEKITKIASVSRA